MKKIIFVLFLIAVLALTGCGSKEAEIIKIGYFGPLTGPVAYSGEPVVTAIQLAHDQQNAFDEKTVDILYEDDKCDPKEAVTIARKLIEVDKVNILISGVCSSSTLAVAPLAEEQGVILISPVAASPVITNAGDNVFRISSSSTLLAKDTAQQVFNLGFKTVGIVYEQNDYPAGWKDAFKKELEHAGGKVIVEESFAPGDTDMKTQLLKVKDKQPDVVLFTVLSPVSADLLLKQKQELGFDSQIVGNEVFSFKSILNKRGEAAEGMLVTTYKYDLSSSEMKSFLNAYKKKHGKEVTEEIYGALGYDVYSLLFEALESCSGDNVECIKDQLNNGEGHLGASGTYHLDKHGDAIREFVLRKVVNSNLL